MGARKKIEPARGRFSGVPGAVLQYAEDESNRAQVEEFAGAVPPTHHLFSETIRLQTSYGIVAVRPGDWVFVPDDAGQNPVIVRKGTAEARLFR